MFYGGDAGYRDRMSDCTITAYEDGPLLVRGPFDLLDQSGNGIEKYRNTIALCRCGRSRIKPFCDGTHKKVGFKAPGGQAVRLSGSVPPNGASGSPPS
jgi:CDGSH-type Zn-finger protein